MAAEYRARMGERIRLRREELGMSRSDLARKLPGKTNENAIYRWEKGEHEPRPDTVEALAEALEVAVHELLTPAADKNTVTPEPFAGPQNVEQRLDRIEGMLEAILVIVGATDEEQDEEQVPDRMPGDHRTGATRQRAS